MRSIARSLDQVQRIVAVFTNTTQPGRAAEIVLESLLEASGMGWRT